jgi:hypothetical protein
MRAKMRVSVSNKPIVPEGLNEGSLARSAWKGGRTDPSRRERYDLWLSAGWFSMIDSVRSVPIGDTGQTVPYGTDPTLAQFQALRARLPSFSPSGTLALTAKAPGCVLKPLRGEQIRQKPC